MRKSKFGLIIALLIAFFGFQDVQAAYLKNVPVTKTQPDGTVIHCFASGDEYFNYLHDADGYTIMQHPSTGYYVYAEKRDGKLVATDYVVGKFAPASKGLKPYAIISPEEWMARRRAMKMNNRPNRNRTTNQGVLNNIAIFIRFSDDNEFSNTFSSIDDMFNDESQNAVSMINYFKSASYNTITIPTHFYPGHSGETIISYQDIYPKNYYEPYNAITNPNGYTEEQRGEREFSLLERAVNYVNIYYPIPTNLNIDHDNDGEVDNVCFIVKGDVGGWNELLWPHMWALQDRTVTINGKRVWTYNFQLADATDHFNTSTMCHEMNHSLGAPDLYHYSYSGSDPVGSWDLMNINTTPPQHCGAYMKMEYGHWIDEIPEITQAGTYTLNPISSATPTNIAYKIASSDPNQFYVLEYRNTNTPFESALPGSGLLIYRIDTRFVGNEDYNPDNGVYDEVYIFRPYGSFSNEGDLDNAHFNSNENRTEFGPQTNPYPFFSEGTVDNSFRVYDITSAASTISFRYEPIVQHTITAIANPTSGGTISGAGTYNENSECTLVATPNDHYTFSNWTKNGVVVSTNPTYTFTVTADETYTANFTAMPQFTITAIANPAAGGIVSGARTYDGNSQCTLKAMPNAHYRFSNWTKNGIQISTNPTYTFTVTADGTYTANFSSLNSHAITCNTVENGTISANPTTAYLGETVTLTANPDSEYGFSEWIVKDANNNLITVTNNRFIMPDSDVTVSAIFTHLSYILYNSSILFALNDYTMTAELIKQWIGFGNGNLIIPSSISTTNQQNQTLVYDVTSIHDGAFNGCHGYTGDLIIPNSVVSIGANAFADCYGFTGSLEIPNSVVSIGDYAFIGCYGFTGNLNIPNSVMTIGLRAFENCSGFTDNLTIGESVVEISNLAFNHCDGLTSLDFNAINCVYVGFDDDFWLKDCSSLSGLTIGQNVEHIPNYFAYKYSGFTGDLIIPNSVVSIGKYAFYDCGGFSGSLILGNSVTTIGEDAFCRCSNFTGGLTIPNSVITIGDGAFAVCSGFTGDLIIPNSVTTIGENAFANCSGFTGSLTIPNSVTTIDYGAFYNCSGLTGSLTIPHSVTSLGELVFENCSFDGLNLDMIPDCNYGYGSYCNVVEYLGGSFTGDLAIGNSVTAIYHDAFNYCSGFTGSLSIGNSVTTISSSAFRNCSGFSGDLVIPNSVTTIGLSAFSGCNGFTGSLSIGNSVTSIGTQAFEGCSGFNGNLIIGNSLTEIGYAAFENCSGFSGDLIIPNSVTFIDEYAFCDCSGFDGTLTLPNALTKISHAAFANCGFVGELVLPNTIISIELNAFKGCGGFTGNLEIPNSVTKIENGAFRNCSGFTGDLVIPNSVTIIGGTSYSFGVFDGCSGFNGNLMIGNSVTTIDNYTFQGCSGLTGELVIPNSVNYIGRYAFSGCSGLTGDLVIPNSVNYIGRYAFSGCSGLTGDLVIPNSVTTIDESTFSDCSGFDGDLSIPIYVTSIGANAFASCNNLSSIHSYNAVPPTLGNNAFNGVNTSIPVYVPSCSATDYSQAARWSNFTNYQATLPCVPTFTGNGTDNLWSNPDNWSAQPDGNYDIIICSNCEMDEDVEASSVIINNTGTLIVKPGHVLTITGNFSKSGMLEGGIVNHGTAANLIIEDGGQLVHSQNGLQGTVQKNISYYTVGGSDGWHLVTYPLVENGSVSSQSNMLNNSYDLYYYDEPTHYWRNYKNASNSFTQLEAGKGYLYANSGVITPIGTRVGNGTGATAYSPFYTYYKFSISENLFRATELETAGLSTSPLGSLCWYATNSTGYEQSGISIWMANVSDSELTETSHLTDGMTLVYTGSMTPVVGWNEFVFNENTFAWDGTSNILVCVQRNNGQWNDKIYWQTHNPGFASKSQQYTDDAAYDMTTQTYSMSVSTNYRPNTIFKTVSEVGVVEQTPIQISFAGELENGAANINLPLSYTESAGGLKGFNLVGNPFVHNVTSFVRTNVAEECYRMNAAKDNLIVSEVSASKPLKPAEGFFVKATAEGASITFNSGAKGETNRSGRINIELRENDPSTSSGTLLIDRLIVKREGEPLEKMSLKENGTRIFAANGNQEMAVAVAEGIEQPVNFKAAKNGTYTLNANVEGLDLDYLHLIDNLTGENVDLLATPSYTFEARKNDYASRFRLVFSEDGGSSTGSETTFFAFISNGEIVLTNAEAGATLQIVDVMGRVVRSTDGACTVSTSGIAPGVYVLRLINGDVIRTQKIVID